MGNRFFEQFNHIKTKTITSNKSEVAFKELTTHEDVGTKLHNINLSTPDAIIEDDIKNHAQKS